MDFKPNHTSLSPRVTDLNGHKYTSLDEKDLNKFD